MNVLAELVTTKKTGKTREIRRGTVLFELETSVVGSGGIYSGEAATCHTDLNIHFAGSYDPSAPGDFDRMRRQGLELMSRKLYGNIRELLMDALYETGNHAEPKVIREFLCKALDETEIKDAEGNPI